MDNGATWSAVALLNTNATTDSGLDLSPTISTDGAGNWVTVWQSNENLGGAGTDDDIFVSRSTDNGASWSAAALLNSTATTDSGNDREPVITTNGAGTWAVVWYSNENIGSAGTDNDIFVSTSTNNGSTWSNAALLNSSATTDTGWDSAPFITTDGSGNWVTVWRSQVNLAGTAGVDFDIFVSRSANNGATWSAPALLNSNATTDTGNETAPVITTDGIGNWVTVWHSNENFEDADTDGDIFVSTSTNNGSTWSDVALLNSNATTDSGSDFIASITTDGAGNWVTVWGSNEELGGGAGADYDIFVSHFTLEPNVLSVPFYLDNASNLSGGSVPADGTASFIGVKNDNSEPVTLTITYTDTAGNDQTPTDNTYVLAANSMVSWRPFADDPAEGNTSGQLVPNSKLGSPAWGSVLIEANGPISGRLIHIDGIQDSTGMMLMPKGGGTTQLTVPFYLDNASNFVSGVVPSDGTASFIGVKNMSNFPVSLTLTYTDTGGNDHTPVNNTYMLPANSMVSWRPFADDPVEGDSSGQLVPNSSPGSPAWGSVLIEADGPITGRLISLDGRQDSTSLMLLPSE
jgi:hypothetical protein